MSKNALKRWALMIAGIMAMWATAIAGVTVTSPANGATSGSPVHFVASASSSLPISAITIYVDGNGVTTVNSASIDTSIPIAAGQHSVIVQAWDTAGTVMKAVETITVTASSGVTVSSPVPNSTVGSPMNVVASATSSTGHPITAMAVYIDGNNALTTSGASVNTSINTGSGSHQLIVQAWDAIGTVYKDALTVNVSGSSPPAPPPGSVVHSAIQTMPNWDSCTVCAGAGGQGAVATYSMAEGVSSPSLSGKAAQFTIGGSTPYANAIWWKQLGADNTKSHFQYDLDFYMTQPQLAEALEFDVNQSDGGMKFIFGTQCNIKVDHTWDVWDTAGNAWRSTGIPCSAPTAFQWHHLTWQFARDSAHTYFIALTLDGVTHYVNYSYSGKAVAASEVNVAFQMDGDYAQHTYAVWLDNVQLTSW